MMDKDAKNALFRAAGPENVSESPSDRHVYGYDASGAAGPAEAVVRAVDIGQISRILAVCTRHRLPIVARGAGSGLTGGAVPVEDALILDMAGLDRIRRIDPGDGVAVVEAGVVTAKLGTEAGKKGMFYPPDPASADICTIGGNLAENAGGLRAVKYGVTRDYVMGVEAVLPDGRIFCAGGSTVKSVVGYDLTRLLVGSEGTLAVIVSATLRLLPLPEAKATVSALFPGVDRAAEGVRSVLASGIRPTALEFVDGACLRAVSEYAGLALDPSAEAMLLIDIDGPPEVVGRQSQVLTGLLEKVGGESVRRAADAAESDRLWRARRSLNPAMRRIARGKLDEDIVVPLGRLAEMMDRIRRVAERTRLSIPVFGHAGDGNLHVNVMFDPEDPEQTETAHRAVSEIFDHTLSLDGSLSGEHGVGITKRPYVAAEIDPVAAELMRRIKTAFDPMGILNPHKALPAAE